MGSRGINAESKGSTQMQVDQDVCPICNDLVSPTHKSPAFYEVLPCKHQFHAECMKDWCDKYGCCPTCNADVTDYGRYPVRGGNVKSLEQLLQSAFGEKYDGFNNAVENDAPSQVAFTPIEDCLQQQKVVESKYYPTIFTAQTCRNREAERGTIAAKIRRWEQKIRGWKTREKQLKNLEPADAIWMAANIEIQSVRSMMRNGYIEDERQDLLPSRKRKKSQLEVLQQQVIDLTNAVKRQKQ